MFARSAARTCADPAQIADQRHVLALVLIGVRVVFARQSVYMCARRVVACAWNAPALCIGCGPTTCAGVACDRNTRTSDRSAAISEMRKRCMFAVHDVFWLATDDAPNVVDTALEFS